MRQSKSQEYSIKPRKQGYSNGNVTSIRYDHTATQTHTDRQTDGPGTNLRVNDTVEGIEFARHVYPFSILVPSLDEAAQRKARM